MVRDHTGATRKRADGSLRRLAKVGCIKGKFMPMLLFGLCIFFLSNVQAFAASAHFCPPFEPPQSPDRKQVLVRGGDVQGLLHTLKTAPANTTVLLADGVYTLNSNQSLEIRQPRITIRSTSRNRDAVIIEGGDSNIAVNVDDFTVADVTLRSPRYHNIHVRGNQGVVRTIIYNVRLQDAGQQLVKVSAGDGTKGKFADDGLIACSLIEYTTYARGNDKTPPTYTNGVDILAGKGWVIRDNVFRRIRSQAGPAGPAILAWRNSIDTVVIRNVIIDSWRGITLGLRPAHHHSRGGPQEQYDHQNGLIENNVILALHEPADAAIENNYALNSRVLHNTVYYNPELKHAVDWAIEYRFPPTTAIIQNNLTNLPIRKRHPEPQQEAVIAGNVTHALADWFRDVMAGDVRLTQRALALDKGVPLPASREDMEGNPRPAGQALASGAYEFFDRSAIPKSPPVTTPRQSQSQ